MTRPVQCGPFFRIIHPRQVCGRHKEPITFQVWPPRGTSAYNFEQAVGVLLVFSQRWLDTGRWVEERFEDWAEPVDDPDEGVDLPVVDPAKGSWTLRDYATAQLDGMAAASGQELDQWLSHHQQLDETFALYVRAVRRERDIVVDDDNGLYDSRRRH